MTTPMANNMSPMRQGTRGLAARCRYLWRLEVTHLGRPAGERLGAAFVVGAALLGVAEDSVGDVDLARGLGVRAVGPGRAVHSLVGVADLVVAGVGRDLEDAIWVEVGRHWLHRSRGGSSEQHGRRRGAKLC